MLSRFRGCLLAGAVGDALGAPIEFASLDEIVDHFGPQGPEDLEDGLFTDDTQMTLFVAEGLIRARNRARSKGICCTESVHLLAFWRWLSTQGTRPRHGYNLDSSDLRSWLTDIPGLNHRRAPGMTCLGSLEARDPAEPLEVLNNSKGCGGVMRTAPIGLAQPGGVFSYACDVAALTHGHPTGRLAAGYLASIIHEIVEGADLGPAIQRGMAELAHHPHHEETLNALELALALAEIAEGTPEEVERLGAGWIAEEALAISVFCAQVAPDLESALRLAVTHSGDSDSTGCITGHILGALHGIEAIPQRWLDQLDLKDVVDTVATDLYRSTHDRDALDDDGIYDWKRYPGV